MANPRIDDLRKKLDKDPGSRLFAQLAEELRKEGELAEAIRVSRHGLDKHPNYPSARMTLGRALLDSGDLEAARREFETVLKGAPDNILASRYLAECLEGLGQTAEALARYKATAAMAPGDKQVLAHIQALEKAIPAPVAAPPAQPAAAASVTTPPAPAAPPASPPPAAEASAEPAPIRLVEIDEPMEVLSPYEQGSSIWDTARPAAAPTATEPAAEGAPIPLAPVDEEEFELERPYQPPPPPTAAAAPSAAAAPPGPEAEAVFEAPELLPERELLPEPELIPEPQASVTAAEPDVIDEEFDVDTPAGGPAPVTFRKIVEEATAAAVVEPAAVPAEPAAEPELASATLAELYLGQGFRDKAIEVYRRLLRRDPDNDKLRARLREIEAAGAGAPVGATGGERAPSSRRQAIERTIERLNELRAALTRKE